MAGEVEAAIAAEQAQIQNAPQIPIQQFQPVSTGTAGRCGWCGQINGDLQLVEVVHGQERFKGSCCRSA